MGGYAFCILLYFYAGNNCHNGMILLVRTYCFCHSSLGGISGAAMVFNSE